MKKVYFSFLFSLVLLATITCSNSAVFAEEISTSEYWTNSFEQILEGDGSQENPFLISKNSHLAFLLTEQADLTKYYRLVNDIDMKEHYFSPIGTSSKPFKGSFDGNGYTISNLIFNYESIGGLSSEGKTKFVGLFGYVNGVSSDANYKASISHLKVKNINIEYNFPNNDNAYIGGIVGDGDKVNLDTLTVENITINAKSKSLMHIGALTGRLTNASSINNCVCQDIDIKFEQGGLQVYSNLGGVVGAISNTKIYNTLSSGKVDFRFITGTTLTCNIGGIVGTALNSSEVINTLNSVELLIQENISSEVKVYMGGVVGALNNSQMVPSFSINFNYFYKTNIINSLLESIGLLNGYSILETKLGTFSDLNLVRVSSYYTNVDNWDFNHEWDFDTIFEVKENSLPSLQVYNMYIFKFIPDEKLNRTLIDKNNGEEINHITSEQANILNQDEKNISNIYYIKYGTSIKIKFNVKEEYSSFYSVNGLTMDNEIVTSGMKIEESNGIRYNVWEVDASNITEGLYQAATEAQRVKNYIVAQKFNTNTEEDPKYDEDTGYVKNENGETEQGEIIQNMIFSDSYTFMAIPGAKYAFSHWNLEYISINDDGSIKVDSIIEGDKEPEGSILRRQKISFVFGENQFNKQFRLIAIFSDNTMNFKIKFNSAITVKVNNVDITSDQPIKIVYKKKLVIEIVVPEGYNFEVDKLANTIANMTNESLTNVYDRNSLECHYKDLDDNDVYKINFDTSKITKTEEGISLEASVIEVVKDNGAMVWIIVGVVLGIIVIAGVVVLVIIIRKRKGGGSSGYKGAFF